MTRKFGREYKLLFGQRDGELTQVSQLRCRFRIEKSNKPTANSAIIEVYNLSEKSRNALQQENVIIVLEAGYIGTRRGVFQGDLTKVEHRKDGADRITVIEAGDAQKDLQESFISKSYVSGTQISTVISDVIGTFKNVSFSQNIASVISGVKELATGGSFEGSSVKVLNELLSTYGLSFSVQDGELIVEGNSALDDTEIQVVSPATGLINSPAKTDKGISFNVLLEPRIRPTSFAQVQSESVSGLYRATSIIHEGDNFERQWYTSVEAEVAQ